MRRAGRGRARRLPRVADPSGRRRRPRLARVRLSLDLPAGLTLADDYAAPFASRPTARALVLLARRGGTPRSTCARWTTLDVRAPRRHRRRLAAVLSLPTAARSPSSPTASSRACRSAAARSRPWPRSAATRAAASWGEDGTIVVAPSQTSGLVADRRARAARHGPLTQLDEAAGEVSHRWPQVAARRRHVLFTGGRSKTAPSTRRGSRSSRSPPASGGVVLEGGAHGRYVASGHLVFARGGRLLAVPFDLEPSRDAGRPGGGPGRRALRPAERRHATSRVSDTGALVYTPGVPTSLGALPGLVDAAGRLTRIGEHAALVPRAPLQPRRPPRRGRASARPPSPTSGSSTSRAARSRA